MNETYDTDDYEVKRRNARAHKIAEMKRKKRQQELRRKVMLRLSPVLLILLVAILVVLRVFSARKNAPTEPAEIEMSQTADSAVQDVPDKDAPSETSGTSAETSDDASQGEHGNANTETSGDTALKTSNNAEAETLCASLSTGISKASTVAALCVNTTVDIQNAIAEYEAQTGPVIDTTVYAAETTASTDGFDSETVFSTYGIMIDLTTNTVLAQQNAYTRTSPASMTKILTVLVAAEHIENLDDTFTMTQEINDYVFRHGCSAVGFDNGEIIPIKDLFYGTILHSGGDAALGLAYYVAGSQEAFVDMMNEKLEQLGLSSTAHFTNCTGLYDENHYCTMYDMAIILEAAINNEWCREVLSLHRYTTSPTTQHPEGIEISNLFLRRIEDKDTHGEVVCAKTGFVNQSRNCAASYGTDKYGNGYIVVTGDAHSNWRCIYDHVALYDKYLPE